MGAVAVGAAIGAVSSAVTGGNIFQGAITGGIGGGIGGFVGSAFSDFPTAGLNAIGQGAVDLSNSEWSNIGSLTGSDFASTLGAGAGGGLSSTGSTDLLSLAADGGQVPITQFGFGNANPASLMADSSGNVFAQGSGGLQNYSNLQSTIMPDGSVQILDTSTGQLVGAQNTATGGTQYAPAGSDTTNIGGNVNPNANVNPSSQPWLDNTGNTNSVFDPSGTNSTGPGTTVPGAQPMSSPSVFDALTKGITPGQITTGALGMINNLYSANKLQQAAQQMAQLNNPLNQAQRAPYQAQLLNLAQNPQQYFSSPIAQAELNAGQQLINSNVAKTGNANNVMSTDVPQILSSVAQGYNTNFSNLAMAGGFTQGSTGTAGAAAAPLTLGAVLPASGVAQAAGSQGSAGSPNLSTTLGNNIWNVMSNSWT